MPEALAALEELLRIVQQLQTDAAVLARAGSGPLDRLVVRLGLDGAGDEDDRWRWN
jgi:hypothetical protein